MNFIKPPQLYYLKMDKIIVKIYQYLVNYNAYVKETAIS